MNDINEEYMLKCIENQTGCKYTFAKISDRQWGSKDAEPEEGEFYQLMPHTRDDGFFDWYCFKHKYEQFFTTKSACAFVFSFSYKWWDEEGRPSFEDAFRNRE